MTKLDHLNIQRILLFLSNTLKMFSQLIFNPNIKNGNYGLRASKIQGMELRRLWKTIRNKCTNNKSKQLNVYPYRFKTNLPKIAFFFFKNENLSFCKSVLLIQGLNFIKHKFQLGTPSLMHSLHNLQARGRAIVNLFLPTLGCDCLYNLMKRAAYYQEKNCILCCH